MMRIKVIGCGGIGLQLIPTLSRFLNYHENLKSDNLEVHLIDGDQYEERNRERQSFDDYGNKAEVTANSLKEEFPNIYFETVNQYLTEDNIILTIREDDVVFLCVDNHSTRKLVSDHCEELDNVLLVSGGNDYSDGNVMIHHKVDGTNKTMPIANEFHPEIQNPEDENPGDIDQRAVGCDVQVKSDPQLLLANNFVASTMLNAFYSYLNGELNYDEVYVDCLKNQSRRCQRS
jgi:molybdopterin/thiamine biosynthesis adenylyltransferase